MSSLPNIPDEVWHRRPWLKAIRDEAHRRYTSADAVLWSVLAMVAGGMPHQVLIDTGIRTPQPPTLFVVLASLSGGGKSTAEQLARDLVPDAPAPLQVSTGEGLIESYYGKIERFEREPQPPDKEGNPRPDKITKKWERCQVSHNAVAVVDEGASLLRQIERPGNVVAETLRGMWTGADVGQANADPERRRSLPAKSYNLGLIIGMQPDISGRLLDDTGTGFAQRFVWCSATDQTIPAHQGPWTPPAPTMPLAWTPPELPPAPMPGAEAFLAGGVVASPPPPVRMSVDPGVVAWIANEQLARARGDVDEEDVRDSQRTALHLKVAGVLTWMDGRLAITVDDWALAGALLDTSDAVCGELLEHVAELVVADRQARGVERAEIDQARNQADVRRSECRDRVIELLTETDGGMSHNAIKKVLSKAHRPHLETAIAAEIDRGTIDVARARSGGKRYTLVSGK